MCLRARDVVSDYLIDRRMPVKRLVLDEGSGTKFRLCVDEIVVRSVRMKVLWSVKRVDVVGYAILTHDRVTSGVPRRSVVEEAHLHH